MGGKGRASGFAPWFPPPPRFVSRSAGCDVFAPGIARHGGGCHSRWNFPLSQKARQRAAVHFRIRRTPLPVFGTTPGARLRDPRCRRTTAISLHEACPKDRPTGSDGNKGKSSSLRGQRSEEHTSELQSLM